LQYRAKGRSRRFTIGLHGVFTPEKARQEARVQLGRIAGGDDPAGERELDRKAITVRGLCEMYLRDLHAGLILGKGQRPKKASTIATDSGRITRHLIPLLATRRVRDLTKPEINRFMMDITAGKTRLTAKTKKLRGKSIVRGGAGTAVRTIGLLGGIVGDRLRPRYGGSYFIVSAAGMLLGFPMFLAVLYAPFPLAWVFLFLAVFCLFFNTGPSNTALANVSPPAVRATAFAINIFMIHLLGDAISPPIMGWIADRWSMSAAFGVVSVMFLLGGGLWLYGARYLARDTSLAPTRMSQ
jgi:hypothetical protein